MLKYVIILFALSVTCAFADCTTAPLSNHKPKFYKDEKVKYQTGFFLHKACSGKGTIDDYNDISGVYTIRTPHEEKDCPTFIEKSESEITANE